MRLRVFYVLSTPPSAGAERGRASLPSPPPPPPPRLLLPALPAFLRPSVLPLIISVPTQKKKKSSAIISIAVYIRGA